MYLLTCCISGRNSYESDMDEEYVAFERFHNKNMSVRMSKRLQDNKEGKPVTGMEKFRTSQKLKRKAFEVTRNKMIEQAELRQKLEKFQSL